MTETNYEREFDRYKTYVNDFTCELELVFRGYWVFEEEKSHVVLQNSETPQKTSTCREKSDKRGSNFSNDY